MPIDINLVKLPIDHYSRIKGKWIKGGICEITGLIHKIGEHSGEIPCVCNIHLVVIDPPPSS